MAKGNGEEISTSSLSLLSQGWDHENSTKLVVVMLDRVGLLELKR
jgi:hypothetical protein